MVKSTETDFPNQQKRDYAKRTQDMSQPLPIQSINHISHGTSRLDDSTTFYRDVLGFRPIQRPPFDFPGACYTAMASRFT